MKQCSKCNQIKPSNEFHLSTLEEDGIHHSCIECSIHTEDNITLGDE